jgi:phytoene dehydrogenase-like protein
VVVLEARSKVGGAAATDAPWPEAPEIKVTRLSYVMSLMPPQIIRELELERHGYKLFPMGPAYQAWPDGRSLTIYDDDARRNHAQISQFSRRDAEAMPRWDAWLEGLAAVLGPLLTQTPPRIGSRRPSDLRDCSGWPGATAALTCAPGEPGHQRGDRHLGWARLARHRLCDGPPLDRRRRRRPPRQLGLPEGGMGAVADAIHRSAVTLGATVRTGARVERVLVSGGRATGVVLAGGEELHALVVATAVHPARPSWSRSTGPSSRPTS